MKNFVKKSCFILAGVTLGSVYSAPALSKDLLVTAARPDLLIVADPESRTVIHSYQIPKTSLGNSPGALVVSKDGKTAYVIHNQWETVSGIDLDTGKEVFRAELAPEPERKAKAPFAIDITPDGKELAVYVTPTLMLDGEYRVEDPYIAIYDTSSGISAKPVRKLPAQRRITTLAYSPDAKRLYAFSWDMLVLDPADGKVVGKHPWRSWKRKNFGEPDGLAVWPQWDATNIFATPYYVSRTDKKPGTPGSLRAGIWRLNLATDKTDFKEFEDASVVLFSSVVNPVRRNEVYTVYTQLTKTDMRTGKLVKRINLDHTYYSANVSTDGREIYIGGTQGDIAVYDSATLEKLGSIEIPNKADMVLSSLRLVHQ